MFSDYARKELKQLVPSVDYRFGLLSGFHFCYIQNNKKDNSYYKITGVLNNNIPEIKPKKPHTS